MQTFHQFPGDFQSPREVVLICLGGSGNAVLMAAKRYVKATGARNVHLVGLDLDNADVYGEHPEITVLRDAPYKKAILAAKSGNLGAEYQGLGWMARLNVPDDEAATLRKGSGGRADGAFFFWLKRFMEGMDRIKAVYNSITASSEKVRPIDFHFVYSLCGGVGPGLAEVVAMSVKAHIAQHNRTHLEDHRFYGWALGPGIYGKLVDPRQQRRLSQNTGASLQARMLIERGALNGRKIRIHKEGLTVVEVPTTNALRQVFYINDSVEAGPDGFRTVSEAAATIAAAILTMELGSIGDHLASGVFNAWFDDPDFRGASRFKFRSTFAPWNALGSYTELMLAADIAKGITTSTPHNTNMFTSYGFDAIVAEIVEPDEATLLDCDAVAEHLASDVDDGFVVRTRQVLFGKDLTTGALHAFRQRELARIAALQITLDKQMAALRADRALVANPANLTTFVADLKTLHEQIQEAQEQLTARLEELKAVSNEDDNPEELARLQFSVLRVATFFRFVTRTWAKQAAQNYILAVGRKAKGEIQTELIREQLELVRTLAREVQVLHAEVEQALAMLKSSALAWKEAAAVILADLRSLDGSTKFARIAWLASFAQVYTDRRADWIAIATRMVSGTHPSHILQQAKAAVAANPPSAPDFTTTGTPGGYFWQSTPEASYTLTHEVRYTLGTNGPLDGTNHMENPYVTGFFDMQVQIRLETDLEGAAACLELADEYPHPLILHTGGVPQTAEIIANLPTHVVTAAPATNGQHEPELVASGR